jgi:predicted nucleotide-binding protein
MVRLLESDRKALNSLLDSLVVKLPGFVQGVSLGSEEPLGSKIATQFLELAKQSLASIETPFFPSQLFPLKPWIEKAVENVEKERRDLRGQIHLKRPPAEAKAALLRRIQRAEDITVRSSEFPIRSLEIQNWAAETKVVMDGVFASEIYGKYLCATIADELGHDENYLKRGIGFLESLLAEPVFPSTRTSSASSSTKPIFIGHGRSDAWLALKNFLTDRLHLKWEEFNRIEGADAGRVNIQRLEKLLSSCQFALLVFTSEDEQADGSFRARQNVVHELGLFQGRLGFERAVALLEDGCEDLSNIQGVIPIRFPKGNLSTKLDAFAPSWRIAEYCHRPKLPTDEQINDFHVVSGCLDRLTPTPGRRVIRFRISAVSYRGTNFDAGGSPRGVSTTAT